MNSFITPSVLQINGKNVHFMVNTGIVDKVSKRIETHLNASASGGGARQFGNTVISNPTTLNVSSSNTTVTELWMRDGDKELDHTLRTDLSVRENQKISILSIANENARSSYYVGVINHNTGTWQSLNTTEYLIHATVMSKMSTGSYFFLILFAFFLWPFFSTGVATVLGLGGIVYLSIHRSNKMSAFQKTIGEHIAEIKQELMANN
jgi:hypothetical protein